MIVLGIQPLAMKPAWLYDSEHGLLADALYSQIDMHVDYGGVA